MKHNEFYDKQLALVGSEIMQVGWHDTDKAVARYKLAADLVNANGGGRIVDVGCGLGTFMKYVPQVEYVGIDIYPPYISKAKIGYPDKFFAGTVQNVVESNKLEVDQYVSLGAYTIIDDSIGNTEEYVFDEIRYMLKTARKSVIINGFHNVVDHKDYKYYHDLNKLVKFSQEFATHSTTIHIFSKYEFFIQFNLVV